MKNLSTSLEKGLNLEYPPVGILYSDAPDPEGFKRFRYACVGLRHAFSGEVVNISRWNLECMGGAHWLGFMDMEELIVPFLTMIENLFEDSEVTRKWLESVPTPRAAKPDNYVVIKPLSNYKAPPQLVALRLNPSRFHDVLGLLSFRDGEFKMEVRVFATCQGVITNPLVTGKPSLCVPDSLSRLLAGFGENDIFVSMPFDHALKVKENMGVWGCDEKAIIRMLSSMFREH